MYEVTADMPRHARVTLLKPEDGWSRAFFEREMAQYAQDCGASRTVTLHPETMAALGLCTTWAMGTTVEPVRGQILVSSTGYPRDRLTLYE